MTQDIYRYYSQSGEDYLLLKFFGFKKHGYFVDVGAFDGVHLSNTLTFEQVGWDGLCVEPNPTIADICKKSRPNSTCIQVACSNEMRKSKQFYAEELGLLSGLELDDEKIEDIKVRYTNRGMVFKGLTEIKVPVNTLDNILNENIKGEDVYIDFISIDVEGHEMDVLRGFDIAKWSPRVIVVEANTTYDKEKIIEYVGVKSNYIYSRQVGANLFFVRSEKDKEKLNSIDIECVIEKQMHPLGLEYTPDEYKEGKVIHQKNDEKICNQVKLIESQEKLIESLRRQINEKDQKLKMITNAKRYQLINKLLYPLDRVRAITK